MGSQIEVFCEFDDEFLVGGQILGYLDG